MKYSRAPLIFAIALLLLPILYVGSYLALVTPGGFSIADDTGGGNMPISFYNYRVSPSICSTLFWPLEQIDRKLRPEAWGFEVQATSSGDYGIAP